MRPELKQSTEYDRFVISMANRPLNEHHVRALVESISKHGFIPAYCLHVIPTRSGKLEITDGQHRFEACRRLRLPVWYMVCQSELAPAEKNTLQRAWRPKDFLAAHLAEQKGLAYVAINHICGMTGMPVSTAVALVCKSINPIHRDKFTSGKLEITQELASEAISFSMQLKKLHCFYKQAFHTRFIAAIYKCDSNSKFSRERFFKKAESHSYLLRSCSIWQDYVAMIEHVYNYHCRADEKLSLKFEVEKAK